MGMVTRHTGLVRSYFSESPQCSTPAICVVWLLLIHIPLNHMRDPSSPHSTVCSFASFSQYSLSHPAFHTSHPLSRPLASTPFPGSSTSGQGPADSLIPAVLSLSPSSKLQHYYLLVNDGYDYEYIYLTTLLSCY